MPGLVVFRRRWSVGSDDLVIPGAFLLISHFLCFFIQLVTLLFSEYNITVVGVKLLLYYQIGYLLILFFSILAEAGICIISMRGSILDSDARTTINLWIYLKSLIIFFDITWLILGTIWMANFYFDVTINEAKKVFIAILFCNWALVFITVATIWCTFDAAGRSWVKMKKYQRSMRDTESRFNYKRSGSMNRNWRQRKVIRAYQDSWDHRCRLLFCCMSSSERHRNSFTDIARLLSDFFRDLDVVPSDVVAGLVLLRKFQKVEREAIMRQRKNGTYEFLSGVPITERTEFLALNDAINYEFFQTVIHYMYFAQGAYGWPMYFIINRSKMWHLVPELQCFGCCCRRVDNPDIIEDNCCYCNYAALKKSLQVGDVEVTYVTYHVDIGETPFFVAVDYTQKKIVVSIRGTLSMKDILTDLNAEGEVLPLMTPRDDWLGHKGMVQAAIYIKEKLAKENLIEKALNRNPSRSTHTFDLVLVGHSLGAGTAAILAILMKPDYPSLQCFSYSPPGGLLSMPAVEYSKSFITSIVLGKDVVPRIGLYQMEALRADLINAIQRSVDPKWKTISCSVICCGCGPEPTSVVEMSSKETHIIQYQEERDTARTTSSHPADSSIALTLHHPLYPPGKIIHIVRHHPKPDENVLNSREPVYQAIWADTTDFDEVLISPVMLQDHMPDKVLAALKKVVTASGPRKPQRQTSNAFSTASNEHNELEGQIHNASYIGSSSRVNKDNSKGMPHCSSSNISYSMPLTPTTQHKVCLETSFTNLQNPFDVNSSAFHSFGGAGSSKTPSVAGSIFGRSQCDISSVIGSISNAIRRSPSIPSETPTVIPKDLSVLSPENQHNGVTLDIEVSRKDVLPQMLPEMILQRQYSTKVQKPKTFNVPLLRRASDVQKSINISLHNFFGVAPLASPETLSEISSISSCTSGPLSLANSIEHVLYNININENESRTVLDDILESQMHTPRIMRRALKFTENLSTCAEDNKNIDEYKRMDRVLVDFSKIPLSDSNNHSFKSAQTLSEQTLRKQQKISADQLEHREITPSKKRTISEHDECLNTCPNCCCRLPAHLKVDSCRQPEHSECICNCLVSVSATSTTSTPGALDTKCCSANSSLEKFTTLRKNKGKNKFSPTDADDVHNKELIIRPGVLESHFPFCMTAESEQHHEVNMPSKSNKVRMRKRLSSEEFIYTQQENLPFLVQIASDKAHCYSTTGGRKRNSYIYPADNSIPVRQEVHTTNNCKYISNVSNKCPSYIKPNSESSI